MQSGGVGRHAHRWELDLLAEADRALANREPAMVCPGEPLSLRNEQPEIPRGECARGRDLARQAILAGFVGGCEDLAAARIDHGEHSRLLDRTRRREPLGRNR